ncbi:NERD nuclease [Acinetobacter sp. NCu2D-2]|nr:nuclease-related domain-containing protein [Acinetobacter sp. NCu2D-2]ANF81149.1 NERD nuclease [Acinetobacter sp. NCu2D-2]
MQNIFEPLFSLCGWMIFIAVLLGIFKAFLPTIKGKLGELAVHAHVKLYLKDPHYILLNDLTLPDAQGTTTQIDHILLSPYGIFVIETKNYKGWIFGGERQKMWTQKIYKQSYKFQNPIHQNYRHIKVLESVLSDIVNPEFMHSVVVFMPEAEFKTNMPSNVFRGASWTDYVKGFKDIVISDTKLKRIQIRLQKEILEKSWKTNRDHVAQLRERYK